MAPDGQAAGEPALGNTRRWAITVTVMLVSVLYINLPIGVLAQVTKSPTEPALVASAE